LSLIFFSLDTAHHPIEQVVGGDGYLGGGFGRQGFLYGPHFSGHFGML
jgi:hypothetical protein